MIGICEARTRLAAVYPIERFSQGARDQAVLAASRKFAELQHIHYRNSVFGKANAVGELPVEHFDHNYRETKHGWQPISFSFKSRKESKPADALDAIYKAAPGKRIVMECGMALQCMQYQGVRLLIGTEQFNHFFGETGIHIEANGNPASNPLLGLREGYAFDSSIPLADPLQFLQQVNPGEAVYFAGPHFYLAKHPRGVGRGLNMIFNGWNEKGEPTFNALQEFTQRGPVTLIQVGQMMAHEYNKKPFDTTPPRAGPTMRPVSNAGQSGQRSFLSDAKQLVPAWADIKPVQVATLARKLLLRGRF